MSALRPLERMDDRALDWPVANLWNDRVTWAELEQRLGDAGVGQVQLKFLSTYAKNQIAGLGSDLAALGHLYPGPVTSRRPASRKPKAGPPIFQTSLPWVWLTERGLAPAPETKLIYYPQYPEIRLSGYLDSSPGSPAELLSHSTDPLSRSKEKGRCLIFGPGRDRKVYAAVVSGSSPAASYLEQFRNPRGRLVSLILGTKQTSSKDLLFAELLSIHRKGWLTPYRLNSDGGTSPCTGSNCHGVTLESELGIVGNGKAAPDYLDWEVKGHKVAHLRGHLSSKITLLTPNPDGGNAKKLGTNWLTHTYGKLDAKGQRWDFGGIHKSEEVHPHTGLQFGIHGYDADANAITGDGHLFLRDPRADEPIGIWSFAKLLTHWQTKHAKTVFVPCIGNEALRAEDSAVPAQFSYGTKVHVGEGTTFLRFLAAVASHTVVLDPGLKSERSADGGWQPKTRFQFRASLAGAEALYQSFTKETIDP
jgi:hypothetical protein